ncbi:MinD-like ATPase involved in chromosome partitioning or flagellar assembly [Brevibacillus aydinogluensis]|jgi:MinD-like ATPase involved in chromosome partitioning or flagellar assembly|uniref:AAA family ATPase n=1 Tax=Brevibacillus aydinogluensis TaxID=927786 RepID=UPI0028936FAC|nr:AAA family ATPase [Brevibacillus aydinogluensis]MDT3414581.1 MinD-like ATPase involved in chromosome partitioning or flagellar assembly [Brevibacillus aydinogluensis]
MIGTQTQRVFSTVPLNNQDATVVSPDQLLAHVRETPNAIVYLLWPEDKVLLPLLRDHARVYVLGNLKSEQYVEEMKEALRNGAHDFLDRMAHVSTATHDTGKTDTRSVDHVIRLVPRTRPSTSVPRSKEQSMFVEPIDDQEPQRREEKHESYPPIDKKLETVSVNFSRLDELHIRPIGGRQMLVVTSTKGGIGKTTVAMNVARLLHDHANSRVILVDLMHPHGNVATRMRIKTEVNLKTWEPYFESNALVTDQVVLTKLVVKHPNGLYVLPGVNVGQSCSPELVGYILTHLSRIFDYVVIDIGPERQDLLSVAMSMANRTLLIVDYDLATIKDTQEYLELWSRRQQSLEKVSVLVNFEPAKKDRNTLTREKCKAYLNGLPIIGFLPEAAGMRAIHNEGKVLVQEDKSHPFSVALIRVMESLVSGFAVKEKQGFFARLFGGKKS